MLSTQIEDESPIHLSPLKTDILKTDPSRAELTTEQSDCPSMPSVRANSDQLPLQLDFLTVVEEEREENGGNSAMQVIDEIRKRQE